MPKLMKRSKGHACELVGTPRDSNALDMAGAAGFETLHSECPSAFAEVLAL